MDILASNMKRKRKNQRENGVNKRQKVDERIADPPAWPLLRQYYHNVTPLRQYLASKLAKVSRKRSTAILRYGKDGESSALSHQRLTSLLDNTAVGTFNDVDVVSAEDIDKDITIFTQQLSSTSTISPTQGALKQSEVGCLSASSYMSCSIRTLLASEAQK